MDLVSIVRDDCCAVNAAYESKQESFRDIARIVKNNPVFAAVDEDDIVAGIEERENLGSTGFGSGIAIPHCRLSGISEFVVGIVTVPGGLPFESIDDKDVRLIVFIIGPEKDTDEHIHLLSLISRTLHDPGIIEELLAQKTTYTLRESFLRHSRESIDTRGKKEQRLLQILVQNEELFDDILQVFTAMGTSSVSILEAAPAGQYLQKIPLFAGFWDHTDPGQGKVILAVIEKSLTNETLRAIEHTAGDLSKRTDIVVVVQDVFYAAGSLEA